MLVTLASRRREGWLYVQSDAHVCDDRQVNVVVALVSAIVGGLVVHLFASVRDSRNAQRAKRIEHLVSAYQRLIDATERDGAMTPSRVTAVESALADVLLLGKKSEVEAAAEFIRTWAERGGTSLRPLLNALPTSLRDELKLDSTPLPDLYNLRITPAGKRGRS
ncbi:MAG: hypothetical protein ACOYEV_05575 [Candidatus Nanopelagicales bacterium]